MIFDVIVLYLLLYISVALHEVMHVTFANIFNVEIIRIKIGADWPAVKIEKAEISPVIGSSYVEVSYSDLEQIVVMKKVVYFLSGIITNLVLSVCFFIAYSQTGSLMVKILAFVNLGFVFVNSIPFFKTDVAKLISFLLKKTKK